MGFDINYFSLKFKVFLVENLINFIFNFKKFRNKIF